MITQINADIREWAKDYKGAKFHAALMDPPYNLESITKRFGKNDSAPAKFGKDGVFQRSSKGFMNQVWDSDVAFDPETWNLIGELLYPGAFIMAYGGTRTYHRMASAIEDAGFIIHPAIGFIFSSGFPKAANISKFIDKRLGLKGKSTGKVSTGFASGTHKHAGKEEAWGFNDEYEETIPESPLAKTWNGYRYGLMATKPAFEFICVAQKPYTKDPLTDITTNGAGALNIDGARVGNNMRTYKGSGAQPNKLLNHTTGDTGIGYADGSGKELKFTVEGRWPSNIVVQHSNECVKIGTKEESYPVNKFTDGAKPFGNGAGHEYETEMRVSTQEVWSCAPGCPVVILQEQMNNNGSKGNVQGIYYNPQYVEEEIEMANNFIFASKVSPKERHAGLEGFTNIHPTLKSIKLNTWLATLLLPPVEYAPRRLLNPFAGALSESIGAELAGWEEVVSIELTPEYIPIGKARAEYWTKNHNEQLSFDEILEQVADE